MARAVGGRGPANIMRHMKGIKFPVNKSGILEHVKKGPGPDTDQVLEALQQIPEGQYDSPAKILKAIGKSKTA